MAYGEAASVPALDFQAPRPRGAVKMKDEVADILKGLQLDKQFFVDKLEQTILDALKPVDTSNTGGIRRQSSGVSRACPDFDIYLGEGVMPVLAQALDALCRQIVRMKKQGSMLDAKVRARFNPITWLAQQLLRRHPRAATTPRRIEIYRNFKDWGDLERGRREMLRNRKTAEEVYSGFNLRGSVGRNTIPTVIDSIDDKMRLKGILKNNEALAEALLPFYESAVEQRKGRRRSLLGGEGMSFEEFWTFFSGLLIQHDLVPFSAIAQGRLILQAEEIEAQKREEARIKEEQRRQEKAEEHQRLQGQYAELYPLIIEDMMLKEICNSGLRLTGNFLKSTDAGYDMEVPPNGPHVELLAKVLRLLGFETEKAASNLDAAQLAGGRHKPLFRAKVKHDQIQEPAAEEKEKSKKAAPKPASKDRVGSKDREGSKDRPPRRTSNAAPMMEGRWWDMELVGAWQLLQELFNAPALDGRVEKKVFEQVVVHPDEFINLKRKVEDEFERRAEEGRDAKGSKDPSKSLAKRVHQCKPSMQVLSQTLKLSQPRLDWLHELFESFLPPNQDGSHQVCGYPDQPAALGKAVMFKMLQDLNSAITEAEFEARFRRIDTDNSEMVEFDEFCTWVSEDEVQVMGASAPKMSFEDLASMYNEPLDLIKYIHACFRDEMPEGQVDDYPSKPGKLSNQDAWMLIGILTPSVSNRKQFDEEFKVVDCEQTGTIEFDGLLELLQFDALPEELRQKYREA
eukprot:TRINITY_DN23785_c0_g1_i1.p1 TRINITY_DN23785_c0_g1~~TRINITY_DN23785_c0_g1_i1.p1  ORF type:complete len:751 (+),score=162.74 TRINITY_DN23785_c0_g1_i1:39-2255(+)